MSENPHKKKVPPPYTAATPDPGAKDHTNLPAWQQKYMDFINSQAQVDYSSGSGQGHNNG